MRGHHALDAIASQGLLLGSLRQTDHHRRAPRPATAPSRTTARVASSTVTSTSSSTAAAAASVTNSERAAPISPAMFLTFSSSPDPTAPIVAPLAAVAIADTTLVAAAVATASVWLYLEPRPQLPVLCHHGLR